MGYNQYQIELLVYDSYGYQIMYQDLHQIPHGR